MVPPKDLPCLTYIYIHIYIDMHICIHIYICIYIHIVLSVNLNHHFCLLKSSSTDSAMFRRMIQWSMEDDFPSPSLLDILRLLIVDCWCCMFIIYILYVYIYIQYIHIYIFSIYVQYIYSVYMYILLGVTFIKNKTHDITYFWLHPPKTVVWLYVFFSR